MLARQAREVGPGFGALAHQRGDVVEARMRGGIVDVQDCAWRAALSAQSVSSKPQPVKPSSNGCASRKSRRTSEVGGRRALAPARARARARRRAVGAAEQIVVQRGLARLLGVRERQAAERDARALACAMTPSQMCEEARASPGCMSASRKSTYSPRASAISRLRAGGAAAILRPDDDARGRAQRFRGGDDVGEQAALMPSRRRAGRTRRRRRAAPCAAAAPTDRAVERRQHAEARRARVRRRCDDAFAQVRGH